MVLAVVDEDGLVVLEGSDCLLVELVDVRGEDVFVLVFISVSSLSLFGSLRKRERLWIRSDPDDLRLNNWPDPWRVQAPFTLILTSNINPRHSPRPEPPREP